MERERPKHRVDVDHPTCPYCKDAVRPSDRKHSCDACMGWQHAECWEEHGRCAACQGSASANRAADGGPPPPLTLGAGPGSDAARTAPRPAPAWLRAAPAAGPDAAPREGGGPYAPLEPVPPRTLAPLEPVHPRIRYDEQEQEPGAMGAIAVWGFVAAMLLLTLLLASSGS